MVRSFSWPGLIDCKLIILIVNYGKFAAEYRVENFFKEFFTTKKNGSGIGLASCKKIMHDLGGDLTCRSVFGESMEFILSFPKVDSVE